MTPTYLATCFMTRIFHLLDKSTDAEKLSRVLLLGKYVMCSDNLPLMMKMLSFVGLCRFDALWPVLAVLRLLMLSCVAHKMTVFDTIANLLEYGNNGDVILWNTFMSEMWDGWLVVSAHVNPLTPGMCTAFDTSLYDWHSTHVYAYHLWKPAQDCEWSNVEMFMFYHDSVSFVGWFIVDFWMLCLA